MTIQSLQNDVTHKANQLLVDADQTLFHSYGETLCLFHCFIIYEHSQGCKQTLYTSSSSGGHFYRLCAFLWKITFLYQQWGFFLMEGKQWPKAVLLQ